MAGKGKIRNLGLHLQNKEKKLVMCVREKAMERMADNSFVDFFLSHPLSSSDSAPDIVPLLQRLTKKKISIRFVNRAFSSDLPPYNKRIVELYWESGSSRQQPAGVATSLPAPANNRRGSEARVSQATAGYERVRVVGKGAFGAAILYKRKDDDSLVIIKEINMHDLSATERQLALNEVSLLSRLDHPCIVSYFDSFEEDGILMIEMEYADGGTLAQYLARCDDFLSEKQLCAFMREILAAVTYLHANNVLHRDLKTANVFLTREGNVKIGDFGISRIMGTDTLAKGAETVVGTPYYISPEMCEGKTYNEKSDIWALGCILYEMASLQKAFEGDNLPALVNKIVKGDYEPVKGPYSSYIRVLIREMLQLDPNQRPSAKKALELLESNGAFGTTSRKQLEMSLTASLSSSIRTVVYSFNVSTTSLAPVNEVPPKTRVSQIAVSENHTMIVNSDESMVYAWGDNSRGQLGTGDKLTRDHPTRVRALDGKTVKKIALGKTFSLFLADRGTLLASGDRRLCGNGKLKEDQLEPQLVNSILRLEIVDIACGDEHAIAVVADGSVYAWGLGANGRLGTGGLDHLYTAQLVQLPTGVTVIAAKAGPDATALVVSDGQLYAMGSNRHNKLNLACRQSFFSKEKVGSSEDVLLPTLIKAFPARIVDVSLGKNHSGVVLESGLVYLFGQNAQSQLGVGSFEQQPPGVRFPVKSLLNKACVMLSCGDGFTLVTTAENELFFWGSKGERRAVEQSSATREFNKTAYSNSSQTSQKETSPQPLKSSGTLRWRRKRKSDPDELEEIIPHPSMVLRLDTSTESGPRIRLASIACAGRKVYVVIETSVPNLISQSASRKMTRMQRQLSAPVLSDETKGTEEMGTWLRKELQDAEHIPIPKPLSNSTLSLRSQPRLNQSDSAKLMREIEALKTAMKAQDSCFQGHAEQMTLLQTKLSELQARESFLQKRDPPPTYAASTMPYKLPYNTFFPSQHVNPSKSCSIL